MATTAETAEQARQADLVQDAFLRGQAALGLGHRTEAIRWLERAHRMAPGDGTIVLSLASAMVGHDNPRAAALFVQVLTEFDVREASLGLATAQFLMGDVSAARAALAHALSRHAPHPDLAALADRVAMTPGWCGISGGGTLIVHAHDTRQIRIQIDDVPVMDGVLPPGWPLARRIDVTAGGAHLTGSPIRVQAIARIEGFVETWEGGLRGWAWHPGDPDTDPILRVETGRHRVSIAAVTLAEGIRGLPPLARPRAFSLPWAAIPGGMAQVHVRGRDSEDLSGSPVPRDMANLRPVRRRRGNPPAGIPSRRPVAVIIAGRTDGGITAMIPEGVPVVFMDRARGVGAKTGTASRTGIGPHMPAFPGHDLVLLEDGTILPPNWLERLREAAYAEPDIGTATPFSNRGIAAYPTSEGSELSWFGEDPEIAETALVTRLDRFARRANGLTPVEIPVPLGPCVYVRGDCLARIGPFLSVPFAQGAEALVEFGARAVEAGWRHIALPGLFAGHKRRMAGGAAWDHLADRNGAILNRLHPMIEARLAAFRGTDPLAPARRRLDEARWRDTTRRSIILVTHDDGGGVERQVEAAAAAHEANGLRAVVLRPLRIPGEAANVVASDGTRRRFPNLKFELPREKPALARFLRGTRPVAAELHHFLNHDASLFEIIPGLGVPYDTHVHDFAWFCPRIALVGRGDRYCGEPRLADCETCVAETGGYLHEDISVHALVERSAGVLRAARRVIAPSRDAGERMGRHFPGLPVAVVPHEEDDTLADPLPIPAWSGIARICVAGAIGLHKGFHVLLACARDARDRGLDLTFAVPGTTIDDRSLIDTGRVFVTGRYAPDEAIALIQAQDAALAFLPSIWPETWCLGLTELWRAGLQVAAFDIGAPAERIRRTGRGFLLPLGMSPGAINDALLNASRGRSFLPIRRPSAYKPSNRCNPE
ncbi:MAG: glycosyl transferase [Acetobacteraceae bacterium]|nr:glycosyl transferase [Acetobacteraceae bacterium]